MNTILRGSMATERHDELLADGERASAGRPAAPPSAAERLNRRADALRRRADALVERPIGERLERRRRRRSSRRARRRDGRARRATRGRRRSLRGLAHPLRVQMLRPLGHARPGDGHPARRRCWASRAARRATTSASSRSTASSRRTPTAAPAGERFWRRVPGGLSRSTRRVRRRARRRATRPCSWSTSSSGPAGARSSTGAQTFEPWPRGVDRRTAPRRRSTYASPPTSWRQLGAELDRGRDDAGIDRVDGATPTAAPGRRRRGAVDVFPLGDPPPPPTSDPDARRQSARPSCTGRPERRPTSRQ